MPKFKYCGGETRKDVVLTLHQCLWQVRTYNGGLWQVYGPGLFHVAEFEKHQQAEAERLCDMHNEALELLDDGARDGVVGPGPEAP